VKAPTLFIRVASRSVTKRLWTGRPHLHENETRHHLRPSFHGRTAARFTDCRSSGLLREAVRRYRCHYHHGHGKRREN
jgi:hypothetical protein